MFHTLITITNMSTYGLNYSITTLSDVPDTPIDDLLDQGIPLFIHSLSEDIECPRRLPTVPNPSNNDVPEVFYWV